MSSQRSPQNSRIHIRRQRQRQLLPSLPGSRSNVTRSSLEKQDRRPPTSCPQAGMNRNGLTDRMWFPATHIQSNSKSDSKLFQCAVEVAALRMISIVVSGGPSIWIRSPTSSSIQEPIGRSFRARSHICLCQPFGWVIQLFLEWSKTGFDASLRRRNRCLLDR